MGYVGWWLKFFVEGFLKTYDVPPFCGNCNIIFEKIYIPLCFLRQLKIFNHHLTMRLCQMVTKKIWLSFDTPHYPLVTKFLKLPKKSVTTLALGSQPRQGFARARAKRETWECGRAWEWTFTLPNELPCWQLESRWTPESSKSHCKGQNPSPWKILYIIEKLLKLRCLKWARMTHLDIWKTSYGQKKGPESNWQFDSRP
jgi:hypothetical protein